MGFSDLKEELKRYLNNEEIEVLEKVYERKEVENYFFNKKSDLKWFYPLKLLGYFNCNNAPSPTPVDKDGYYTIPQWNVLPYFEKISQQVNIPGNEKYINELLGIIKEVSNYKDKNGQHIDNYRTWWFFIKILLNIPNEKIPLEIIELIPIWLESRFDNSLAGSDSAVKLLPKFLLDKPTQDDIQKAEKIIDYITAIRTIPLSEDRAKVLAKTEEKKLVLEEYWLKTAFEKHSASIGEKCTNKVINDLTSKIKQLLKREDSMVTLEINNQSYNLILTENDTNYVLKVEKSDWASEKEMIQQLVEKKYGNGEIIKEITLAKYTKKTFVDEAYKVFVNETLFQGVDKGEFKKDIRNLYRNLYTHGTYESFYEDREHLHEPLDLFTLALKRILIARAKTKIDEAQIILNVFVEDNYLYFTKMALYIIGQNIDKYSGLFWRWLRDDTENVSIHTTYWGDELKHLLQNLKEISQEQLELLKKKIEEVPEYYYSSREKSPEYYKALYKQEVYQALRHIAEFDKLYKQMKETTNVDVELRPAIGKAETRSGPGPAPLSKEEILQKSNVELAQFLSTFKTKDHWRGPTVGGLSEMLKATVTEQPEKFVNDLTPFLNSAYLYIYDILWGISDAWKGKKHIEWGKLFDFIKQYINRDEFWQDKFQTMVDEDFWKANHEWVIGVIGELIQEGTKTDEWAFDETLSPKAQEILLLIINRLKQGNGKEINDPVTHTLNSSWGKVLTALILLSLRIARVEDKKGEKKLVKWSDDLKSRYIKALNDGINEAHTLLGRYMPNLYYLDKGWVEENIKKLEAISDGSLWSAFMTGYLWSGGIYDNLYGWMRNHYLRALDYEFKERNTNELLIEHITIGYLREIKPPEGQKNLFDILIERWNYEQIEELIGFFWMQRDYLVKSIDRDISVPSSDENEKLKNRIFEFWRRLFKKYDNATLNGNDKKIISAVSKLTVFLPQIDSENSKWLELSALYVNLGFDYSFFIEYLDEVKDKEASAQYIGKIFLKMLDAFTPDYDQKHIRSIVEYLYGVKKQETIDSAKAICDLYAKRGFEFLRDIYEKNKDVKASG